MKDTEYTRHNKEVFRNILQMMLRYKGYETYQFKLVLKVNSKFITDVTFEEGNYGKHYR